MSWLATNFIAAFLLPPLCFLLLLGLGIVFFHRRPKLARFTLLTLFILIYVCSTPYCTDASLHLLEVRHAPLHPPYAEADAIVILGGGSNFDAPEYAGQDTVSDTTLQRVRYAAVLQRATGKPILTSGGKPKGGKTGEAVQMRDVLEQELHVPVRWIDDDSDNTFENARNSYQMLHTQGIQRIYLVTHAWHMPRAMRAFQDAGFTVVAAPTAFTTGEHLGPMAFIPRAESLRDSKIFMHELIGLLWYRIKSATN